MKVRTGIKWVAAIMLMVVLCFSVTVAGEGIRNVPGSRGQYEP